LPYWAWRTAVPRRGARRPAPRARELRLAGLRPPSGFKRLHASERQHLRKRRKSFRIQSAERPRHRRATRGRRTARPHLRTAPPVVCHRGTAPRRSDAPPRAPRTPVPETARARRAACQGRTGAVAAGRVSGASGRSATLCVCHRTPRRGERLRAGARAVPAAAPAPGARPYARSAAGPVS
jgi:hypothetical protein